MEQNENGVIKALRERAGLFRKLFLVALALLLGANVFVRPQHPHLGLEMYPGFWAVFGFVLAVAMAVVMKRLVAPILEVSEDIHD